MVSGLGQFIGATFDAPVSVVEIFLSEGGDGALVDDLRYVAAPSPAASAPLPAGLPLLVGALGAFGLTARRRKPA